MEKNYFAGCNSLLEVKAKFRELAFILHPDKGGSTAEMQDLLNQFHAILKNPVFRFSEASKPEQESFGIFADIVSQLAGFNGLKCEICGLWLWVSGNTYFFRAQLKEMGFFFAPQKKMWYWRPAEAATKNKKPLEMEKIRQKYGSNAVSGKPLLSIFGYCMRP